MKVIEARGTHRAIGQAIGEALRDEIRCHLEGFVLSTPAELGGATATFRGVLGNHPVRAVRPDGRGARLPLSGSWR